MDVVLGQHVLPDFWVGTLDEVPSLSTEHAVLIRDRNELKVILALAVGNVRQVWVTSLAVLAHLQSVVQVVLLQELFRVVVRVDVDLGQRVVDGLLLVAGGQSRLQEWQQKLQPVAGFDL